MKTEGEALLLRTGPAGVRAVLKQADEKGDTRLHTDRRETGAKAARVGAPSAFLRREPRPGAEHLSQCLYGEPVSILAEEGDYAFVRAGLDRYLGWIEKAVLSNSQPRPTHLVARLFVPIYPEPDLKCPALLTLPQGARLAVMGETEKGFVRVDPEGWVWVRAVKPLGTDHDASLVPIARQFLGTPYVWGGRTGAGIDCSGLVQQAALLTGQAVLRDTDMQQESLGKEISAPQASASGLDLVENDLVFFPGHVGIMTGPDMLLHANAHHMMTVEEPLQDLLQRLAGTYDAPIRAVRRPDWL